MTTNNENIAQSKFYTDHTAADSLSYPPAARFSLLAQECYSLKDRTGVAVFGYVHGEIK